MQYTCYSISAIAALYLLPSICISGDNRTTWLRAKLLCCHVWCRRRKQPSWEFSFHLPIWGWTLSHISQKPPQANMYTFYMIRTYVFFRIMAPPSPIFNAIPTKTPRGDGNRASFEQRQPLWISGSQDFGCVWKGARTFSHMVTPDCNARGSWGGEFERVPNTVLE